MGLGSFMQNFAIGALGQINQGYADQHRQQAQDDAENAQMVRNVAQNTISRYQAAEEKANDQATKYRQIASIYGPGYAKLIMAGESPDNLYKYSNVPNDPNDRSYLNDLDSQRFGMYNTMLNSVKSVPANRHMANAPDLGQIFTPPSPYGDGSGFKATSALQQQQLQAHHPDKYGNVSMPDGMNQQPPMGQPQGQPTANPGQDPSAQPTDGTGIANTNLADNSGYQTVPIGSQGMTMTVPTHGKTPDQSMIGLSKAIGSEIDKIVAVYDPNAQVVGDPINGISIHFKDTAYGLLSRNLRNFGQELVGQFETNAQADAKRRGVPYAPKNIDPAAVANVAEKALNLLLGDLNDHGFTDKDQNVKALGNLSPEEFMKAVHDANVDIKNRTIAEGQDLAPGSVGTFLDPKKAPQNTPEAQFVQQNYEAVVHSVTDHLMKTYDDRYDTSKAPATAKRGFNNPSSIKALDTQARMVVNHMTMQDFQKAVNDSTAEDQSKEINAEPWAATEPTQDNSETGQITREQGEINAEPLAPPAPPAPKPDVLQRTPLPNIPGNFPDEDGAAGMNPKNGVWGRK